MNKEKLEEIVEKISEQTFDRIIVPQTKITIEYQDIKFLINAITKQDERVHELSAVISCVASREVEIVEQNQRFREALEFYADRDNYELEYFDPNLGDYMSTVDYDEGAEARKALEGESE